MTRILAQRKVFSGKVTEVHEYDLDFNGHETTFELITFKGVVTGVVALPIDSDGNIVLIKHYQLGLNGEGWCLPSGGLYAGEDPAARMQLELQEEIGYKANTLTLMTRVHSLPGYIGTEPIYLFLATNLEAASLKGDEDYQITVAHFSLAEVSQMMERGEITDGRTMLAVLWYQRYNA